MSAGQDLAGIGYRYHVAAEKQGKDYRSVMRTHTYLDYPVDIYWQRQDAEIRALFKEADVIHLNGSTQPYTLLGGPQQGKPAILEHHGTAFRGYPGPIIAEGHSRHLIQAVSTIDLLHASPELLSWLPAPYDLPALKKLGKANRRPADGRVLVATAPTARGIKSTELLIQAVAELAAEGLPVDLDVIENLSWAECLKRKARADIFFDQVILGYGCNAIEAWGMGIPVIAGADEWTLGEMYKTFDGAMPFYAATTGTIKAAVAYLSGSADARAEWASVGLTHALRWHGEKPALARAEELYEKAVAEMAGVALRQRVQVEGGDVRPGPGVFYSPTYRALMVHFRDAQFKFAGGYLVLDDPYAAGLFRAYLESYSDKGIVELPDAMMQTQGTGG